MNFRNPSSVTIQTQESYDCDENSQHTIDSTILSKNATSDFIKCESKLKGNNHVNN
jgi:hypothetical protein